MAAPGLHLPPSVLGFSDTHIVGEDLQLRGVVGRSSRYLLALRRQRPELGELQPLTLALLAVHVVSGAVQDSEEGGGHGLQVSAARWAEELGYSPSHVKDAFKQGRELGLLRRYEQLRTVKSLTEGLAPKWRREEWTCKDGKEGRKYANVYSVSYATSAGAALLEGLGQGEVPVRGELRRVLVGFLGRLARALRPTFRKVARRLWGPGRKKRLPDVTLHTLYLASDAVLPRTPSYPQATSSPLAALPVVAGRAPPGARKSPESMSAHGPGPLASPPPETAAGQGGGWDRVHASLVAWCLNRRVWEPVLRRVSKCRCSESFRRLSRSEGFGRHQSRCPLSEPGAERWHLRRVGWRRVVSPVLTVEQLWPAEWARADDGRREELLAKARPIFAEVFAHLERERVAAEVLPPELASAVAAVEGELGAPSGGAPGDAPPAMAEVLPPELASAVAAVEGELDAPTGGEVVAEPVVVRTRQEAAVTWGERLRRLAEERRLRSAKTREPEPVARASPEDWRAWARGHESGRLDVATSQRYDGTTSQRRSVMTAQRHNGTTSQRYDVATAQRCDATGALRPGAESGEDER